MYEILDFLNMRINIHNEGASPDDKKTSEGRRADIQSRPQRSRKIYLKWESLGRLCTDIITTYLSRHLYNVPKMTSY